MTKTDSRDPMRTILRERYATVELARARCSELDRIPRQSITSCGIYRGHRGYVVVVNEYVGGRAATERA